MIFFSSSNYILNMFWLCSIFVQVFFDLVQVFIYPLKSIHHHEKKSISGSEIFASLSLIPYFPFFSLKSKYFWYFFKFHAYFKYVQIVPKTCSSFFLSVFNFLFTLWSPFTNTIKKKKQFRKRNIFVYIVNPHISLFFPFEPNNFDIF